MQTLWAALPLRGRALPGASQAFRYPYPEMPTPVKRREEGFFRALLSFLPQGKKPLFIGGRGFGRARLLAFLLQEGGAFVSRVKREGEGGAPWEGFQAGRAPTGQRRRLSPVNSLGGVKVHGAVAWGGEEPWSLLQVAAGREGYPPHQPCTEGKAVMGASLGRPLRGSPGQTSPPRYGKRLFSRGKGSVFFLGLTRNLLPPPLHHYLEAYVP